MQYVFLALAGVLVGGVIALRRQDRPRWVLGLVGFGAGLCLWIGLRLSVA